MVSSFVFAPVPVHAAVNQEINFQGKIVDKTSGINVSPACVIAGSGNDTCDFRVSVFANSSGGTALWSEILTDVEIGEYSGMFNLAIGSYCITNQGGSWTTDNEGGSRCNVSGGGVPWGSDNTIYLEVELDPANTAGQNSFSSPEVFSRKLISSVPFALHAETATSLNGFSDTSFVKLQPNAVQSASGSTSLIWIDETGAGTPNLIELLAGGISRFIVGNNGNTSIGTTTSTATLNLAAATSTQSSLRILSSGGTNPGGGSLNSGDLWWNGTNLNFYNGSASIDLLTVANSFQQNGNSFGGTAVLGTNDNNVLAFETNNTERARLDTEGRLGIGTNNPTGQLQVQVGTTGSGATTMSATSGSSTFTTSATITLNVGDYIVPNLTSIQSRVVTVGGTGTSFTVSPAFTGNVTNRTFLISRKVMIEGSRPVMSLRNTLLGTQEWQLRVGAQVPGSTRFDIYSASTGLTALSIDNTGNALLGTDTNMGGPGNASRLFVYGGTGGANIDVMGDGAVSDQATLEVQGSDYSTASKSAYLQFFGPNGVGSTFGQSNQNLGVLAFAGDTSIIGTKSTSDLLFGTDNTLKMKLDINGNLGIGVTTAGAFLDIKAPTNTSAQINLTPSASIDPASPNSGDLWWNGTNLNFRTGSGTVDLLSAANAFVQNGNSFGTSAVLGTNDGQSLILRTAGTDKLFINTIGGVGLGGAAGNSAYLDLRRSTFTSNLEIGNIVIRNYSHQIQNDIASQKYNRFLAPTINTTGGARLVTEAANLYIDQGPIAGGSVTITNNYALWVDNGTSRFDGNVTAGTSTSSAFLTVAEATSGQSSMRILTSGGINPSAPNNGDLWWNGTNLNFRTGTGTIDLAACGSGCVLFAPAAAQTTTLTNSLINLTTTANTTNGLLVLNENGTGTPNLINAQVAGINKFAVDNNGGITTTATATATSTTTTGTGANTTILTVASTTSFSLGDLLLINGATYTKVISKDTTTQFTVSPAVSWSGGETVVRYTSPNIGDSANIANRYNQGFFLNGIVTGSASTTYADQQILSTSNLSISSADLNLNSTGLVNINTGELKVTKNQIGTLTGNWITGKPGGTGKTEHTSVVYNNKMYAWGGAAPSNNTMNIYDFTTDTWATGTAGGTARGAATAVVYNNKMYIWGGFGGSYLNTMDIYDFVTNTWSVGTAGGTARNRHTAVVYNNKMYIWGGFNGSNLNTMDIYDFVTNTWSVGVTGGTARTLHTSVVFNNKMYVWAGSVGFMINTMDVFDFTTNTWSVGTAGGTARNAHTAVVYDSKMYLWGGHNGAYINTMDIYDFTTNTWSAGTAGGTGSFRPTAVVYNNKMYAWGGYNGSNLNTMDIYNFGTYDTIFGLYSGLEQKVKIDARGNSLFGGDMGIGIANNGSSYLKLAAATTLKSQLNFLSSGGIDPASPTSGDLWWNGTNLNFRTGAATIDLAACGSGCVSFAPASAQTTTLTNSLINLTTTANTTNGLLVLNENGAGTPNLINAQVAGINKFAVDNNGGITTTATATATSTTTTGTGSSASVFTVTSTTGLSAGDLVLVNGVTYTRIISVDSSTLLTVSPVISWSAGQSVVRYTSANIGDSANIANRYNQGFFLNGIVTGSASTTYADQQITATSNMSIRSQGFLDISSAGFTNINSNGLVLTKNPSTTVAGSWSAGKSGGEVQRNNPNGVIYNGKLYVFSGTTSLPAQVNTMVIYDVNTNSWSSGPTGGNGHHLAEAVVHDNKIYLWGGYTIGTNVTTNTMDVFDLSTNTWSTGVTGGTARFSHSTIVYNGKMYVYGGALSDAAPAGLNTMDVYDFATNTWSTGTAGGTGRRDHSAVVYNGRMYVWGGRTSNTGGSQINTMDVYDFATNTWSTGTAGGTARFNHQSTVYDKKMYSWAGNTGVVVNTMDTYDFTTNAWTTGVAGGTARENYVGGLYNNKLYYYGSGTGLTSLDIYDFGNNDTLLSLLTGRQEAARVSNNGDAYFAGSISNNSFKIKANGDIELASGATRNIVNAAGSNLVQITDIATNFGATVEAGAMISRNSYEGEEFSRERADLAADTVNAWGDTQAWTVDEQTAGTNDCVFGIANNATNGIGFISTVQANTTCMAYNGSAVGTMHRTYAAGNLPTIIMKIRPSAASATVDTWAGLMDTVALTATDPTNGIYFTNNNGNVWTGVTRNASTSTNVTCTGATISTTQFALLKIEVRSTTDVRFYVDADVSNGVSWTSCGTSTTNIPTTNLASAFKWSFATAGIGELDIDYYRAWQDDSADSSDSSVPEQNEQVLGTNDSNSGNAETQPEATPSITVPVMSAPVASAPVGSPEKEKIDYQKIFEETTGLKFLSDVDSKELRFSPISAETGIVFSAKKVTFTSNIKVAGTVEVSGDLIVAGDAKVTGGLYLGDQNFGTAKVAKGETEVEVKFTAAKSSTPFITINPTTESTVRYWISSKDANGFKIKIETTQEQDVEFEWVIINKL